MVCAFEPHSVTIHCSMEMIGPWACLCESLSGVIETRDMNESQTSRSKLSFAPGTSTIGRETANRRHSCSCMVFLFAATQALRRVELWHRRKIMMSEHTNQLNCPNLVESHDIRTDTSFRSPPAKHRTRTSCLLAASSFSSIGSVNCARRMGTSWAAATRSY